MNVRFLFVCIILKPGKKTRQSTRLRKFFRPNPAKIRKSFWLNPAKIPKFRVSCLLVQDAQGHSFTGRDKGSAR